MTKILFAWDFHGVLEKDNEYSVQEICNRVLKEKGIPRRITLTETIKWYGLRWFDYFKNLSPASTEKEIVEMVNKARELSKKICRKYIKPMDHASEVLDKIHKLRHLNLVISNSRQDRIEDFIRVVGLDEFIDCCVGIDKHLKSKSFDIVKEKANIIKSYIDNCRKVVMVGDNKEDIEAGELVEAVTYFFLNRFNKKKSMTVEADHIISDLRDVLEMIHKD